MDFVQVRVEDFWNWSFEFGGIVYIDHGFERRVKRVTFRVKDGDSGGVAQVRRGFRMANG